MTLTLASDANHQAQTPNQKDYTTLYQEIADYVIIKAHSGDPFFEKIFEWAWKKSRQNKPDADPLGVQATESAAGVQTSRGANYETIQGTPR